MRFEQTGQVGPVIPESGWFGEDRGFFSETWNRNALAQHGLQFDFVQDDHSVPRELNVGNDLQLLIPAGVLHGFISHEPDSEIICKCSDFCAPETEGAARFDDTDIGIDWGLDGRAPRLSPKDAAAPCLCDTYSPFA